jgi:hypothetical protein
LYQVLSLGLSGFHSTLRQVLSLGSKAMDCNDLQFILCLRISYHLCVKEGNGSGLYTTCSENGETATWCQVMSLGSKLMSTNSLTLLRQIPGTLDG